MLHYVSRHLREKKRKKSRRDKHRGRCSQLLLVADRCSRVCVCGGGVDGFWCVINQQHLPWHCLDSRLRAALLCCALFPLSAIHLSSPPPTHPPLFVYLSGSVLSLFFSPVFISPAFHCFLFSLYLPVWLFLSVLSFPLLISVAFLFNPLSLSHHFSCPPLYFFPVWCSLHPDCLVSGGWLLEQQSLIEMGSLW